jgi:hypothetical protein
MATTLKTLTAIVLLVGLGGCVAAAGISTWGYRSGAGYETERTQENRIQVDSAQGLTREACTRVGRRQMATSGDIMEDDLTAGRSN